MRQFTQRYGETNVDALIGEAGRDSRAFFFGFGEEDWELFDGGHGDIASVIASKKGLKSWSALPET